MWVDALYEKVRVDDRVESMAVVIATGVNLEGRREVLGLGVIPTESEEGWAQFFKSLKERGLRGVKLVISDAHTGLKAAVRKVHFYRNVSANPIERLNLEIRRRTRVVGILPHAGSCLRLIGMLLVEKNEDWLTDGKAYLTFDDSPAEESAKILSLAVSQ